MARKKPTKARTALEAWMDARGVKDEELAPLLNLSRVQVLRLRHGINGASVKTARKLASITGKPWHEFLRSAA